MKIHALAITLISAGVAAGCATDDMTEDEVADHEAVQDVTPYYGCWVSSGLSSYIYQTTSTYVYREKSAAKGGRKVRTKGRGTGHPYSVYSDTYSYTGSSSASFYYFWTLCKDGRTMTSDDYYAIGVAEPYLACGTSEFSRTQFSVYAAGC